MRILKILSVLFLLHALKYSYAQEDKHYEQVVRGVVVDKQTQMPLPGAHVVLTGSDPLAATATNPEGEFRLTNVPLGRQRLVVSSIGYHNRQINNLIIHSARETVLFIEMEEKVETTQEVVVIGNYRKDQAMNKMASVSARAFTVEEAARYAGSREDVARMAMNFAGVSGANDQRNDIIIRGNTPGGILWQLEDVDIPNPNHFAASGTTGGPVGMLNNNTLRNSDFFSGAFPAEYTNVFSGVFDLKMRDGNNEKYELLGQAGFNGFELGAEGPLKKGSRSSFLVNYRYSTLKVFELLGINFGTSGVPYYQDLNFKVNVPFKKGKLTWFGLAGKSSISMLDSEDNETDMYTEEGMDLKTGSSLFVSGLKYAWFHNEKTYSRFVLSYIGQNGFTDLDQFDPGEEPEPFYREDNTETRLTFKYILNTKFSRQLSARSGFTVNRFGYNLNVKTWEEYDDKSYKLDNRKPVTEGPALYSGYSQLVYKFSDRFEIKPGLSFLWFGLNDKISVEPRLGINWKTGYRTSLNFGYGKHSKAQTMATYFMETIYNDGSVELTNSNLGFTGAHHWVLGFDALLSDHLRLKTETYYQYLYDVPVEALPSSYSVLNAGSSWGLNTRDLLINEGEGRNYGVEFTLEKFYHNDYYFLTTLSLFDSKYTGSDGKERNTAFNGNFVANALVGKEIRVKENAALVFDAKVVWAGGKRYTPIDLEASRNDEGNFNTVYKDELAYSKQFPDYFKADIKIGFRLNGKKVSQLWEFYIENITHHKNPINQLYSKSKDQIETVYQLGFFPMLNYRIYF
ncbi:TonB-dependent receptor [Mariniphaga sediminis]|uniref:TonB-dependent receptor n=1 Tax=Mariniphaga sediminis TaxID=1628158 RepID=A0A399D3Z0_9BACT|nr:carboxypeptidase-like regulatory domain-containing protein [Mariniphaga sediminis]RIH66287.1 TonB-dependent receptor [Mariniphaga sediminis]